jgi:subtilisin family serine protease
MGAQEGNMVRRAFIRTALLLLAFSFVIIPDVRAGALRHDRARCGDVGARAVVLVARRGKTSELLSRVRSSGGRVCDRFARVVTALVPQEATASLAANAAVLPAPRPYALGEDEGVAASNADAWQAQGLKGAGTTVAVIDLGFRDFREAQAAGELPQSVVPVDYCPGEFLGGHHGTAVAEVVAAVAPATQIYLICVDGLPALARAEAFVVAHGIRIVNHSVGWFNAGPGDGSGGVGTVDAIVADARAHGVLWVNAAGNETQRHWRGTFVDADRDGLLDFAPGVNDNYVFVPPGGFVCAYLRWYEWPKARHEYDLSLVDDGTGLAFPASRSGAFPLAQACWGNPRIWDPQAAAVRVRVSARGTPGTAPLELFVEGASPLEHPIAAGSVADPATSPSALAVGAICWQTGALETYSSQGPTIDGRVKPDLVAPDSVSSAVYGAFSQCGATGFTGTSASAPHVAGAAALVEQRFPSLNLTQVRTYLIEHADDLGAPGADNMFGAGRLMMPSFTSARPVVNALGAHGSFDSVVRLAFQLGASPIELNATVDVFRGQSVIASRALGSRAVDAPQVVSVTWHAPPTTTAAYTFCVTARDSTGASSAPSCARIRLRATGGR